MAETVAGASSGDIPEHWPSRVCSGPAHVRDEASDNQGGTRDKPRQRIQMLVTAGGSRGMPAGRAGTIALHPRDVDEKGPRPRQQAEG